MTLTACASDPVSLGQGEPSAETGATCLRGPDGIVEGDVQVSTQAELDELAGCREVTGSLDIRTSISLDLKSLAALRVIRGTLRIQGEGDALPFETLSGLENLQRVGELFLIGLDIESLSPLASLVEVRPDVLANPRPVAASFVGLTTVFLRGCPRLVDLSGLENLVVWDELDIADMPALESLRGLVTIRSGQRLSVRRAPRLRDLAALGAPSSMASLTLVETGIESFLLEAPLNIQHLEFSKNPSLTNLDGLLALKVAEELIIVDNDSLEQLPEVQYLSGRALTSLTIRGNDALRSIPAWIVPDEADFLPPDNLGEPNAPRYFFPPEFRMAEIADNAQLTSLSLPSSFRFGGRVRISGNARLTTLDMHHATDIEHLFIRDNPALVDVDVSALENVDDLHVVNNPGLAPAIFERVESRSAEMQGNLEPTPP